ncbi:MGMT family protein [Nocardioides sp. Y6]|uniref:MGMT family protein n=1 Tax=Nocardioides malaquae TaxID=2773426 RepID=A0ABR9RPL1_9ACTN|nr:MGMT family protein [Nocardioides malaquae]MBE7323499.1 MGMT family protein [Nocardioides malaquae]
MPDLDPKDFAGPEGYAELVLRCVERVPRGRVTTYGAVADAVGAVLGRGGPRVVASVMRRDGVSVCWWRLVRADGSMVAHKADLARAAWLQEGTPLRSDGRVDMARALAPVTLA